MFLCFVLHLFFSNSRCFDFPSPTLFYFMISDSGDKKAASDVCVNMAGIHAW